MTGWRRSWQRSRRVVAKIDDFVEEYLNRRRADDSPPKFPITSQIEGGLRELRVRFANTRYRLLYQRSGNLVVLLHALEKNSGAIAAAGNRIAQERFADFMARMDAEPRERPRAGIDEGMRAQLLGLLERFDLDFVLTSPELWGCYAECSALGIYHLHREPGIPGVATAHFHWDGERRVEVGSA